MANLLSFVYKTRKIQRNPYAHASFSKSEIVKFMVNIFDAQNNLSLADSCYVEAIYKYFLGQNKLYQLNLEEYQFFCFKILANFDLVAPYWKFCGNRQYANVLKEIDFMKEPLRKEAQNLYLKDKFLSKEWETLLSTYIEKFYDPEEN